MKKIIYAMTVLVLSTDFNVVWAQKDGGMFSGLLNKIKSKFSKPQDSDKPELDIESIVAEHTVNSPDILVNKRNAVNLRDSDKPELSIESIIDASNAHAKSKKKFK
jgi:hypothetical protein